MTVTDFAKYPSTDLEIALLGEPVLRQLAQPVTNFEEVELTEFCQKLHQKMLSLGGVGIAAPQVFCSRQIMLLAPRPNARYPNAPEWEPMFMFNPKVINKAEETEKDWEGCLSIPGIRARVPRPIWVEVSYQNETGETNTIRLEQFLARVFLHEFDHLIGLSYLDNVDNNRDIVSESYFKSEIIK
ncbi:MAG: peptide deformylase [Alteromonadaceae bacterium]|nr:peptide deformylase [Alteromonadaceae bacterium]